LAGACGPEAKEPEENAEDSIDKIVVGRQKSAAIKAEMDETYGPA
jgi:hypothetical protein